MEKKYIFQCVDINSIHFVNNKNDISFKFHNCTVESGDYCGTLTCINILSLKMLTGFDDDIDIFFPQHVIDVYVETQADSNNSPVTVMLQGGPYDISIICKEIIVSQG